MKTIYFLQKICLIVIICVIMISSKIFSQGVNWRLNLNNNVGINDGIGSSNNADLNFFTSGKKRLTITKDGDIHAFNNFNIFGKIEVVNIRILDTLKIGNESLSIAGGPPGGTDNIQSTNGIINFGGNPPLSFDNIQVGIGTQNPQSLLHVHSNAIGEVFRTDCFAEENTFWRLQRNATEMGTIFSRATGGELVGVGDVPIDRDNFSIQATTRDITFHTLPPFIDMGHERMRIVGVHRTLYLSNAITTYHVIPGNVGIGNNSPVAMLQIGEKIANFGGYRDWMNIGTLYSQYTDNMYVGLRSTNDINVHDAIINWGNNPNGTSGQGTDRLRFVFTALIGGGFAASGTDGLEIARMVTDGNTGRMGVGDFFTTAIDPLSTLDVRGNAVVGHNFAGQVTAPANGLLVEGFTGIGTTTPQRRLEITDGIPDNSGLRLTNLTSATIPMPINPGAGVLAVNGDGDVVYVDIETYLKKIEMLEARLLLLEECLALMQPTQANK